MDPARSETEGQPRVGTRGPGTAPLFWRSARLPALGAGLVALSGCGDGPVEPGPTLPAVVTAHIAAEPGPIFRTLGVELDREARVLVDYGFGDGETLLVASQAPARSHELVLPRLRADREYRYRVRPVSPAGDTGSAVEGSFATAPLPPALAALGMEVEGEATFDLLLLEIGEPSDPHLPVIVDTRGRVVWHSLHQGRASGGFALFADSLFAFNTGLGIQVVSPRSQELVWSLTRARAAQRTGIDPFVMHHEVVATPAGTLLFLAHDTTVARDTVWVGEAVWEWDPVTDALDLRWTSEASLDPATDRGGRSVPDDWLHANSLAVGPRGNVLVSLFFLHEVLSLAPGWEGVEWRLGGPASTFQGVDEAMEAGQHTAAEVATDRVLLFDNGRDREAGRFSRALELALDRQRGTAEVVWEFRPSPDIYAPIVSSARRLPNGNTVVLFGLAPGFVQGTGPLAVYEVTPASTVVWSLELTGVDLVYRATPLTTVAGERPL